MSDFYDDGAAYITLINGEIRETLYERDNGDIVNSEGEVIANKNDDDFDDKMDDYDEGWRESNWSRSDWANFYSCDERDVEDCMDDDDRWD